MDLCEYLSLDADPYDVVEWLPKFASDVLGDESLWDADDLYDAVDQLSDSARRSFVSWAANIALPTMRSEEPTDTPAYAFFSDVKLERKPVWLIHFTNHATKISREGFSVGWQEMRSIALTMIHPDRTHQKGPGWNFAFPADSRIINLAALRAVTDPESAYGREAVSFRAPCVRAFHLTDRYEQAIFWGPSARDIVPIRQAQGGWVPGGLRSAKSFAAAATWARERAR